MCPAPGPGFRIPRTSTRAREKEHLRPLDRPKLGTKTSSPLISVGGERREGSPAAGRAGAGGQEGRLLGAHWREGVRRARGGRDPLAGKDPASTGPREGNFLTLFSFNPAHPTLSWQFRPRDSHLPTRKLCGRLHASLEAPGRDHRAPAAARHHSHQRDVTGDAQEAGWPRTAPLGLRTGARSRPPGVGEAPGGQAASQAGPPLLMWLREQRRP